MSRKYSKRRASAATQWVVIAAATVLALVGSVAYLGTGTNTKLQQASEDVGDPTKLTQRFGCECP